MTKRKSIVALCLRKSCANREHIVEGDFVRRKFQTSIRFSQPACAFREGAKTKPQASKPMGTSTVLCYKSQPFHSSVNSSFHPSTQFMMPVRRRRRGTTRKTDLRTEDSNSEESDGVPSLERIHSPVTDSFEFTQAASLLLDKIEKAVEPMKLNNAVFITKRTVGELGEIFTIDLGPKIGLYQIEISQEEHVFEFSSPVSGKLLYCLSSATGEWVNVDDGHQFEGILVRDLLRSNCIGLPDL